jgi:hypothetical protein
VNWIRDHWSRIVAGTAIAAVAAVTGRVSYTHIYRLSVALHQPEALARLMPFGVDGLIMIGSLVLLQSEPGQKWLGWLGVGPGMAVSLFANVESGIRYGWLAATWAGVPAISFSLATFILERWLKAQVNRVAEGGPEVAPADVEAIRAEVLAEVLANQPRPCPHGVAETAEDAVINAYLHRRDCLAGTNSQRALSSSFGVSRQRVAELVGPLNGSGPEGQSPARGGGC